MHANNSSYQDPGAVNKIDAHPTSLLKNKWMEFLFSNFFGTFADSSPPWEGPDLSAGASGALGSSLAFTVGAASAATAGGGVSLFLDSAA